jgi:hypothetical protein
MRTTTLLLALISAVLSAGPIQSAHAQNLGNFIESYTARLEQLLDNGRTTRDAIYRVINGTPLIRVDIYTNGISVTILSD